MNSENTKISDPHRLLLNLTDKINLWRSDKYDALSNVNIYYTWKNIKISYKNNTFEILIFVFRSAEGFDSQVSLSCFISICAIAPLIICFDLKSENMFNKITTSLLYYSITVFIILLQIFFCLISCQYFVI